MIIAFLVEITQRRHRTSDATVGALEIPGNEKPPRINFFCQHVV
jgi:hypothetical protein